MKDTNKRPHSISASDDDVFMETPRKKKKLDLMDNISGEKQNGICFNLEPEDEVYQFSCPSGFDVNSLKKYCPGDKNSSVINSKTGEEFTLREERDQISIQCIISDSKNDGLQLLKLPITGRIYVHRKIEKAGVKKDSIDSTCYDSDTVPFPKALKIRHPLLGPNWPKHLKRVKKILKKIKNKEK